MRLAPFLLKKVTQCGKKEELYGSKRAFVPIKRNYIDCRLIAIASASPCKGRRKGI
jgi:hypothetical protein